MIRSLHDNTPETEEKTKDFDLESLRSKLGEGWDEQRRKGKKVEYQAKGRGYRVQAAAHCSRVIAGAEKYMQASMRQIGFCVAAPWQRLSGQRGR
jgi:hypothetical protein